MLWGSYKRSSIKILISGIIFFCCLAVGLVALYQFTSVQTKTVNFLASRLGEKIGMPIKAGSVYINWRGGIVLKDVLVLDQSADTLISAGKIEMLFSPLSFFSKNQILLNKVRIDHGNVCVVRHKPGEDFNISIFVKRLRSLSRSSGTKSKGRKFKILDADIKNSSFKYSDPFKDSITDKFNYNQFRLVKIDAGIKDLQVFDGNFFVTINQLTCQDSATLIPIREFQCNYGITDTLMSFYDLSLTTDKSQINTNFGFKYASSNDLSSFNDKVTIEADVNKSTVNPQDLGYFASYFKKIKSEYVINGKFKGQISNFDVHDFTIKFGNLTRVTGNLYIKGLPDVKNSFIDLKVKNSFFDPEDLRELFPNNVIQTGRKFGNSSFIGRFTGFTDDFVANASFFTQIGNLECDINFKLSEKENTAKYSGKLQTEKLNLGVLLDNQNLLQEMDIRGDIE